MFEVYGYDGETRNEVPEKTFSSFAEALDYASPENDENSLFYIYSVEENQWYLIF